MGWLLDFAILGTGDYHMVCFLIEYGAFSCPETITLSSWNTGKIHTYH